MKVFEVSTDLSIVLHSAYLPGLSLQDALQEAERRFRNAGILVKRCADHLEVRVNGEPGDIYLAEMMALDEDFFRLLLGPKNEAAA